MPEGRRERRADPSTGTVWTLDHMRGSIVHLVRHAPESHTTRSYATWITWERVTDPQVARVAFKDSGA